MKYSNSFTKIFLIIISIIFLTSCKTFQLVEKYELVSPLGIKVKPEINWNQVQHSNNQFGWTIDGPVLNEILFISADENEYFLPFKNRWGLTDPKSPQFDKSMTLLEIPDLFIKGIELYGAQLNIINLESVSFLNNNGFKFDFELITENGLKKLGIVYGTIINEKLYLMTYAGTEIEFYARGVNDFIQMAESATL